MDTIGLKKIQVVVFFVTSKHKRRCQVEIDLKNLRFKVGDIVDVTAVVDVKYVARGLAPTHKIGTRIFRLKALRRRTPGAIVGIKRVQVGRRVFVDDETGYDFEQTGSPRLFWLVRFGWLNKAVTVDDAHCFAPKNKRHVLPVMVQGIL